MKLSFYQIPHILINNSSYFGNLIEQKSEEVNVNLESISQFSLLLSSSYIDYNYLCVEKDPGNKFYYFLEGYKYYDFTKTTFTYKIDILRTVNEMDVVNHEIKLNRYSHLLNLTPQQSNYFWKNQDAKLNANVIEKYNELGLKYSDDETVQAAWQNLRWVYIWLQPRSLQKVTVGGLEFPYKYMFTKLNKESTIEVLSTDLPLGQWPEKYTLNFLQTRPPVGNFFYDYPLNQLYYITDAQVYVRFVEKRIDKPDGKIGRNMVTVRGFITEADISFVGNEYYMNDCPVVEMNGVPNSLYCLVLPTIEVDVIRQYATQLGTGSYKAPWSADKVLPYLFDAQSENNWGEYIVDMKVSMIPPFDLSDPYIQLGTENSFPTLMIKQEVPSDHLNGVKNLFINTVVVTSGALDSNAKLKLFLPFLRKQPNDLFETVSEYVLPQVDKETVIKRKYLLSTVEQRIELDIPLLQSDGATELIYYEDLNPGRTNILLGFVPPYEKQEDKLYYLLHSPSTLFMSRDTSMPVFTTAYQAYLASNKNFIQQAELQRNVQLANSLINAGSQAVGATAVAASVPSYSPGAAYMGATGQGISAFITHDMQKKLFNWNIDNMKNAPGNYKSAAATVTFMLTLNIYNVWIETFKSNDFDVTIYEDMISEIGYSYYNFIFNLKQVLATLYEGTESKKYLSGLLTGITNDSKLQMPILTILVKQLQEGVSVYL